MARQPQSNRNSFKLFLSLTYSLYHLALSQPTPPLLRFFPIFPIFASRIPIAMKQATPQHRVLLGQEAFAAMIGNALFNAGVGWFIFRKNDMLTFWGKGGISPDLLATGFILPVATCLIFSLKFTFKLKRRKKPLDLKNLRKVKGLAQRPILLRALLLGTLGFLLGTVPVVFSLPYLWPETFPLWWYVTFKGIWAGVLSGVITPFVAWWVLVKRSKKKSGEGVMSGVEG